MHEKTKQALHQASIDDTMKSKDYPISTQEAFLHGADSYRNIIWHDIQAPSRADAHGAVMV